MISTKEERIRKTPLNVVDCVEKVEMIYIIYGLCFNREPTPLELLDFITKVKTCDFIIVERGHIRYCHDLDKV